MVCNTETMFIDIHMPICCTSQVRDQEVPIKRDFARVVIHVEDCNDHPPQFSSLHYKAEVLDCAPIGTEVVQVQALDQDQGVNAEIHYYLQAGKDPF